MSNQLIARSSHGAEEEKEEGYAKRRENINEFAERYAERRSALMPALHLYQEELGYISQQSMREIAEILDLPPVQVYEVASFYHHFRCQAVGKHHLKVCNNISCMLMGSDDLLDHLKQCLAIDCGETTSDGKFTLSTAECLGSCDTAPVMQINNDAYCENLDIDKLDLLLTTLKNRND